MPAARSLAERFEEKVDRSGGPDACHVWTSSTGQGGGPVISIRKRTFSARRVAWQLAHGVEPGAKRWVTVTCGNVACVNPAHLKLRAHHDDEARFWSFVDKNGPVIRPELGPCWVWSGAMTPRGYGWFHLWLPDSKKQETGTPIVRTGKAMFAHRFSWELANGAIEGHQHHVEEEEISVCHHCDNPKCVRPDHLWLGSDQDNMADMRAKGRMSSGPKHSEAMRRARENMKRSAEQVAARIEVSEAHDWSSFQSCTAEDTKR